MGIPQATSVPTAIPAPATGQLSMERSHPDTDQQQNSDNGREVQPLLELANSKLAPNGKMRIKEAGMIPGPGQITRPQAPMKQTLSQRLQDIDPGDHRSQ